MANLQGLNVVHAAQEPPHADLQDTLTSPFPDFSAHLDLWTNLTFDTTDDPRRSHESKPSSSEEDRDDDNQSPSPLDIPFQDNHDHPPPLHPSVPHSAAAVPPFDINSLLASFGANPLLPPAPTPAPQQNNAAPSQFSVIPSLAQLIALQTAHGVNYSVPPPAPALPAQPASVHTPVQSPPAPVPISDPIPQPSAKRARTAKNLSLSSDHSDVSAAQSPQDPASPAASTSQNETTSQTFAAAEDKRRRNTAASARFRLKKKEREAALERRAKELEDRVLELERECEGLRRENGWLKGLVVGVTGAGATQQPQQQQK